MADEKEFVLTREGKLELENELDTLKLSLIHISEPTRPLF